MKHFLFLVFVFCCLQGQSQKAAGTPVVADSASIYNDMAHSQYGAGNYDQAILYMSKAIASFPVRDYLFFRGYLYLAVNRYKEAFDDFSVMVERDPKDLGALCFLGNARMGMKQYSMAVSDYTRAIEAFDATKNEYYDKSQSYELRARAYVQLGQYSKALDDYTIALQVDPINPQVYHQRAEVYEKLGMYQEAQKDYEAENKIIEEANK